MILGNRFTRCQITVTPVHHEANPFGLMRHQFLPDFWMNGNIFFIYVEIYRLDGILIVRIVVRRRIFGAHIKVHVFSAVDITPGVIVGSVVVTVSASIKRRIFGIGVHIKGSFPG